MLLHQTPSHAQNYVIAAKVIIHGRYCLNMPTALLLMITRKAIQAHGRRTKPSMTFSSVYLSLILRLLQSARGCGLAIHRPVRLTRYRSTERTSRLLSRLVKGCSIPSYSLSQRPNLQTMAKQRQLSLATCVRIETSWKKIFCALRLRTAQPVESGCCSQTPQTCRDTGE